jgi:ABC-2 type transport system permease protein
LIASLRAELLKSRKRWANWILFLILIAILFLIRYLLTYYLLSNPPARFESPVPAAVLKHELFPENLVPYLLASMSALGAAIMIILGGLSTASEYGWLTVQTILLQKPGRTAVLVGKLLSLAIISLLVSVAVLALAALASSMFATLDGIQSNWPSITVLLKGLGALWLELSLWTAFGMFLGVAFRSTAAAIGGGLTYLFVGEALIGQLFRNMEGVKEILRFLPGINAGAVNDSFPFTFRNPGAGAELVSTGRGVLTVLIYLAFFTTFSLLIFQRRDVTGA